MPFDHRISISLAGSVDKLLLSGAFSTHLGCEF